MACEHKKVIFTESWNLGDKTLKLYHCLNCNSTITLKRKKNYNIIDKKDLIIDVANILRNYLNKLEYRN